MPLSQTEYSVDLAMLPLTQQSAIVADVAITTGGTYYPATSFAIQPGLYQFSAQALVLQAGTAGFVTGKLLLGTTVLASVEQSVIASGECMIYISPIIINVTAAATLYFSVTSTVSGGTIKYVTLNNGTPANCTWLQAVRLK